MTDLIDDLEARGLINQMTSADELKTHLQSPRALYCGFDPTADSLHIGSLVPLLVLKRFQQAGHTPILLVGGATGLIGDPSFKATERKLNSDAIVHEWVEKLKAQTRRFVNFDDADAPARMVNNYDWTHNISVLDFLRDIGKHFSVNAMVQKESVKQRIEREGSGISFTEFSYMILQSYDFSVLNKEYDCTVQIGGSDQWGNITGGIDLTRRLHQQQVFGLTLPLVTKADGTKFGKTESGTIWLDAKKTSPYAFYQFWLNTADADVYRFLRYFTFLSVAQIAEIERADAEAQGKPQAQGILAKEVTELVHGVEGREAAERITRALFSGELSRLTEDDLAQLALDGMPFTELDSDEAPLIDALVDTGLASSRRAAREFLGNNAVAHNGEKTTDLEYVLTRENTLHGKYHILKRGKKLFHLLAHKP